MLQAAPALYAVSLHDALPISGTTRRLASIEGVEIKALCDLEPDRVERAKEAISSTHHQPDGYSGGEDEWKKVCERGDIHLVAIATPWHLRSEERRVGKERRSRRERCK